MSQTPKQAHDEAIITLYLAVERALFATGREGANGSLTHPLRGAWEACRDAMALAKSSGLMAETLRTKE